MNREGRLQRPVFQSALAAQIPLYGANIPRGKSRAIYAEGYWAVFSLAEQARLGLNAELRPAAQASLIHAIVEGHCHAIDAAHATKMLPIQRARDAAMALRYLDQPAPRAPAVFIVGAQHARKDFGIPSYLLRVQPQLKIFSLGLGEEGTAPESEETSQVFDARLLTAPAEREDPCLDFNKKTIKS